MGKKFRYLFLLFLLMITINISFGEERKVVIDLKTGDIKKLKIYLLSGLTDMIEYYKNNLIDLKAVVVIHGDAYKFFIKNLDNSPYHKDKQLKREQKEIYERLKTLHKIYNIKFEMCDIGRKARKISKSNLYSFVKLEHSAGISLVNWQNQGYAYLPIH